MPYREKEEAKALGAKWDPNERKWFIYPELDQSLFSRWM
ncbi:MAG: DUF5710 domain-containing protein [Fusobacteriaceae bacterium]|nr:DUF5710 domain-containing protein [Fusobacteriaceae bacterium]